MLSQLHHLLTDVSTNLLLTHCIPGAAAASLHRQTSPEERAEVAARLPQRMRDGGARLPDCDGDAVRY